MKKLLMLITGAGLLFAGHIVEAQSNSGRSVPVAKFVEEMAGQVSTQLRTMQDENAKLELRIAALERKIDALSEKNEELAGEVKSLKRKNMADAEAYERQMKTLTQQLERIAGSSPAPSTASKNDDANTVFEEYIVQPGATLSVIAKSYGVTIQSIRDANRLKGDMLRVGQKLLIPQKSR